MTGFKGLNLKTFGAVAEGEPCWMVQESPKKLDYSARSGKKR